MAEPITALPLVPATTRMGGVSLEKSMAAADSDDETVPVPSPPAGLTLHKHTHYHAGTAPEPAAAAPLPPQPAQQAPLTEEEEEILFPENSVFPAPCFHCKQHITRSYVPEKEALYACCSNSCGTVVLHASCSRPLVEAHPDRESLVCSECHGEIQLVSYSVIMDQLRQLWSMRGWLRLSPLRLLWLLVYWTLWIVLVLGYAYKIHCFCLVLSGISSRDTFNNPWLRGGYQLEKSDIFRYVFVPSGEHVTKLIKHRLYVPETIISVGMRLDGGHVWMAVTRPFLFWYVFVWRICICQPWRAVRWVYRRYFRKVRLNVVSGVRAVAHAAIAAARARQQRLQQHSGRKKRQ